VMGLLTVGIGLVQAVSAAVGGSMESENRGVKSVIPRKREPSILELTPIPRVLF